MKIWKSCIGTLYKIENFDGQLTILLDLFVVQNDTNVEAYSE